VALSFGPSIGVVSPIGLGLNITPRGVRLDPILISLAVFVIAASGVAAYRREKLAPEERFRVLFNVRLPSWLGQSTPGKVLSVVLAVAMGGGDRDSGMCACSPGSRGAIHRVPCFRPRR